MATLQTISQTDSGSQAAEKINGNFSALNDEIQQAGQGGGSTPATPTAWQSMWVLGDSTASDGFLTNVTNSGGWMRYTTTNVYRALARMVGVASSGYNNLAVHGTRLSDMLTKMTQVSTDADIVFIQSGVNDISQSIEVGDVNTVLGYTASSATIDDTMLGIYYHVLLYLRDRCPNAKIVCVSPLLSNKEGTKMNTFRSGVEILCEFMGGTKNNIYYVSGLAVGIDSGNIAALFADGSLHPNKQGAIVIASHILAAMKGMPQSVLADRANISLNKSSIGVSATAGSTGTSTLKFRAEWWGNATIQLDSTDFFSVSPSSIEADSNGNIKQTTITITFDATSLSAGATQETFLRIKRSGNEEAAIKVTGTVS